MLKFKSKKFLLLVVLILVGVIIFTACNVDKVDTDPEQTPIFGVQEQEGEPEKNQETTGGTTKEVEGTTKEAAWTIIIETPDGESVDFTDLDLKEIGKINMKATTKIKDGTEEENEWTGVRLKKVLEFANIKGYELVEIEAEDGFLVEYTKEIADSDKTILAIKKDGETLDEDSGPTQMVVEGERANLWIRNVAKIRAVK